MNQRTEKKVAVLESVNLRTLKALGDLVPSALATIVEIIEDPEAKDGDRLKAAKMVLEYAVGRPAEIKSEPIETKQVTTDVEITEYIEEYGEEKLQKLIENKYAQG